MPLNYSENKQSAETGREKNETALREEIERLKKILDVKEKEVKSALATSSLKKEILLIREKIKLRNAEYEKIRENKEFVEEAREKIKHTAEEFAAKRTKAPTAQQIKAITNQIKDANVRYKLSLLVNLALNKSIYYAVKVARNFGNAYLLDRFHDVIVNELYEELVKNKKIKPIK